MTVPVKGVRMTAFYNGINGVAGQTVLPENRGLGLFEVGLIPDVHAQLAPLRAPRGEVGLIDGKFPGVFIGNELRLTGHGPDMFGIFRLAETHIIIAADGVAIGFEVDVGRDIEIHRTAHILHYQTITARGGGFEVDIPNVGTDKGLLTGFLFSVGGMLPELHRADIQFLLRLHII